MSDRGARVGTVLGSHPQHGIVILQPADGAELGEPEFCRAGIFRTDVRREHRRRKGLPARAGGPPALAGGRHGVRRDPVDRDGSAPLVDGDGTLIDDVLGFLQIAAGLLPVEANRINHVAGFDEAVNL